MKEIIVNSNNKGQRFDKYLIKLLPEAGKGFLYKMLRKKNITLNGKKAEGTEIISEGDVIKIFFSDDTFEKFSATNKLDNIYKKAYKEIKGIKVLFENEHILALNKPSGILCQTDNNNNISLNEWINGYLQDKGFKADNYKPSICNRLDFNTSGIVMAAKTYAGSRYLFDVISGHEAEKYYLAICHGIINKDILLEGYLLKDEKSNKVKVSDKNNGGDYIKTNLFPICSNAESTLLKIRLYTGKSHQIRAHLSSIGHPLCGDIKYGGKIYKGYNYQMLHAYKMILPINNEIGINEDNKIIVCNPPKSFLLEFKDVDIN